MFKENYVNDTNDFRVIMEVIWNPFYNNDSNYDNDNKIRNDEKTQ